MFAKQCDRCRAFYTLYNVANNRNKPNGVMVLNIDERGRYYSHCAHDLCPSCMKEFLSFIEPPKE